MRRQNETFRRLARAPFGDLLNASVREPALLLYLDAPSNRKDHPNENLARELMELFTLGIGNFTEADVKEAARTLTGWTVDDGAFREVPLEARRRREDRARPQGTLAGVRPSFDPARSPATARRIARRICGLLMGEGVVDESATTALADDLSAHRLDVGHAVETVLRSRAFFAAENIRSRVVGPVEFVVGACRALGARAGDARARCYWPTGRAGSVRSCSSPPTSAAGREAGRGCLLGHWSAGSISPRPSSKAALSGCRRRSTPARSPPRKGSGNRRERYARPRRRCCWGSRARSVRRVSTDVTPEAARQVLASLLASPEAQIG